MKPTKGKADTTLTISVHAVAKGVYAARVRYTWVGWFEQGDGLTMVDAAMDPYAAAALEDTIRAYEGDKPVRHVILTHAHEDHVLGAKRFVEKGAKLIAQASVTAAIDSMLGLPHETSGTIAVKDHYELGEGEGDRVAQVAYLGKPAHSKGDIVVFLPKEKVLFAGDIVSYKAVPWMLDPDMSVEGWSASLDSLLASKFPADSLVPGHGQIGPRAVAAGWTKRYIQDAMEKARKTASWGTPLTAYKDWGYLGAYENTEFYWETHFMNMRRLYNEAKGIKTPGRRRARAIQY